MPLLDHFHPPLSNRRHWHSFHHAWATYLAADLNATLPEGYFAESHVQFGIEVDVATFREEESPVSLAVSERPDFTIPYSPYEDRVEVEIFGNEEGPRLAAAIELVSPANKDRAERRRAFVEKCHHLLRSRVGLVIVDVVTSRNANLHEELVAAILSPNVDRPASKFPLYSCAYRPCISASETNRVEVWARELLVGSALPELPLWLSGDWPILVDLECSYRRTCAEHRLPVAG